MRSMRGRHATEVDVRATSSRTTGPMFVVQSIRASSSKLGKLTHSRASSTGSSTPDASSRDLGRVTDRRPLREPPPCPARYPTICIGWLAFEMHPETVGGHLRRRPISSTDWVLSLDARVAQRCRSRSAARDFLRAVSRSQRERCRELHQDFWTPAYLPAPRSQGRKQMLLFSPEDSGASCTTARSIRARPISSLHPLVGQAHRVRGGTRTWRGRCSCRADWWHWRVARLDKTITVSHIVLQRRRPCKEVHALQERRQSRSQADDREWRRSYREPKRPT